MGDGRWWEPFELTVFSPQMVLCAMLGRLGIKPTVVGNGLLAVEAVEQQSFALVLMDINMPVCPSLVCFELGTRLTFLLCSVGDGWR